MSGKTAELRKIAHAGRKRAFSMAQIVREG